MDTTGFAAPRPTLDDTIANGHIVIQKVLQAGLSARPRLFCSQAPGPTMIPELDGQDVSDLPIWATEQWDGTTTLQSLGFDPVSDRLYLQLWLQERDNFYDVADVNRRLNAGQTLQQALV